MELQSCTQEPPQEHEYLEDVASVSSSIISEGTVCFGNFDLGSALALSIYTALKSIYTVHMAESPVGQAYMLWNTPQA